MAQRKRKDPIAAAQSDVEKATKALDKLNANFRDDARKAVEDGDTEKYDSLTETYMQKESELRREVEVAYGDLGDAQRGLVTGEESEKATEKAVDEEQTGDEEPVNPATESEGEGA